MNLVISSGKLKQWKAVLEESLILCKSQEQIDDGIRFVIEEIDRVLRV